MFVAVILSVFFYAQRQGEHDQQFSSLLGEGRVMSQRLSTYAVQVTTQEPGAFDKLQDARARIEQVFSTLRNGDPVTGMPPAGAELQGDLGKVMQLWNKRFDPNLGTIFGHRDSVVEVRKTVREVNEQAGHLLTMSDEVATLMVSRGIAADQAYIAGRQLMLSQRFANNVNQILAGAPAPLPPPTDSGVMPRCSEAS